MTSKRLLSASAVIFVLVTGMGVQFFGEPLFSLSMVLAAMLHLTVAMKSYPKIDCFSVGLHYGVLVMTLTAIVLYVRRIVGPTDRILEMLLDFQEYRFLAGPSPVLVWALVALGTLIAAAVLLIARVLPDAEPGSEKLSSGFFVASIVAFPCDYSIVDPLASVGATRPEEARPFIFAAGLDGLVVPIILHVVILLAIIWRRWSRLHRALQASPTSTERPDGGHK